MMPRTIIAIAVAFVAVTGTAYAFRTNLRDTMQKIERGSVPAAVSLRDFSIQKNLNEAVNVNTDTNTDPAPTSDKKTATKPLAPKTINLAVPFILQAPYQNWDTIHEDACEEASAAMINLFYQGITGPLTKEEMDRNILEIVAWENANLGGNKDTSAKETARVLRELYDLNAEVVTIKSMDDVKKILLAGKPVIVPAYGKALKNPNFRNGGPIYHMLVIKGFTATKIITNDPGTRNGPDYLYDPNLLWGAIHDWNGGDVPNGDKVMIVIE